MYPLTKSLGPPGGNAVIEARGLVKRYDEVVALAGLDQTVSEGTVLGW
jgi:ABC-type multidrug transport system ATPase subunit